MPQFLARQEANSTATTGPVTTTNVPFTTIVDRNFTAGETWTGQANASFTVPAVTTAIANFSIPITSPFSSGQNVTGTGIVVLSQSPSITTNNTASSNATSPAASESSVPKDSGSSGLSSGAVAGVAIGALAVGALIASVILIVLQKRRQRRERQQPPASVSGRNSSAKRHEAAPKDEYGAKRDLGFGGGPGEKSSGPIVASVPVNESFDLDRLLPQPLDDSTIRTEVQNFLTQIDGHVENFYNDGQVLTAGKSKSKQVESGLLQNPTTRLFAIKRIVCLAMIEAMSLECPSDRSLLPGRLGSMARQLKELNLDNHANALSWSRLRVSIGYLLKADLGSSERKRVDQAVANTMETLNEQIQPLELAQSSSERAADLEAICRACASLGRLLLTQPAAWKFDWQAGSSNAAGSRGHIRYLPGLVRLTDNRARKLPSAHVALSAKVASL